MSLYARTADHLHQGLTTVERLTPHVDAIEADLVAHEAVDGVIVLATCNRVEIFTEISTPEAYEVIDTIIARHAPAEAEMMGRYHDDEILEHLFRLACGLESQVVGEKEITGQMRRALGRARNFSTASFYLAHSFDTAIRASKRVNHETGLAGRGRSIVSVGLAMIDKITPLASSRCVIVGTGNYAGAVAAALKEYQVCSIQVWSESGRAKRFAEAHQLEAVDSDALVETIADADLVATCRGFGRPAIPVDKVQKALTMRDAQRQLTILDLAITHDVEASVADLDRVRLIDLHDIYDAVPEADRDQVMKAEKIIAEQLDEFAKEMSVRGIGHHIADLHSWADRHVQAELARLGEHADHDAIQSSLRRLSASLIHLPIVLLRRAAADQRAGLLVNDIHDIIDQEKR